MSAPECGLTRDQHADRWRSHLDDCNVCGYAQQDTDQCGRGQPDDGVTRCGGCGYDATAMNTRYPYWPELSDDEGDALTMWFDDTCGDCIEGRCHWGGETSRRSIAAAQRGDEFDHPTYGVCGCARHRTSVLARPFRDAHDKSEAAAVAWRDAKTRGDVVVDHD